MKNRPLILLSLLLLPAISVAQAARIEIPAFDGLDKLAKESVNITLDGDMLQTAGRFVGSTGVADPAVSETLKGLKGIYVRSFEFDQPNVYNKADVDAVRAQLTGPGWSKLLSMHSKADGEDIDIWLRKDSKDGGLVIIASEPKELTIVNIVGQVDLEKLRQLQGKFGIPGNAGGAGSPSGAGGPRPPAVSPAD